MEREKDCHLVVLDHHNVIRHSFMLLFFMFFGLQYSFFLKATNAHKLYVQMYVCLQQTIPSMLLWWTFSFLTNVPLWEMECYHVVHLVIIKHRQSVYMAVRHLCLELKKTPLTPFKLPWPFSYTQSHPTWWLWCGWFFKILNFLPWSLIKFCYRLCI